MTSKKIISMFSNPTSSTAPAATGNQRSAKRTKASHSPPAASSSLTAVCDDSRLNYFSKPLAQQHNDDDTAAATPPSSPPRKRAPPHSISSNSQHADGENIHPNSPLPPLHCQKLSSECSTNQHSNEGSHSIVNEEDIENDDDVCVDLEEDENDGGPSRRPWIDQILPSDDKNEDQIKSENDVIKCFVNIFNAINDNGRGNILNPDGVCWPDINLVHQAIPKLPDCKKGDTLVYLLREWNKLLRVWKKNKGGYSRHGGGRFELGYKSNHDGSPIPVLARIHSQDPITHHMLTNLVSALFKQYGTIPGFDTFAEMTCGDAFNHEKKNTSFFFTMLCNLLCQLEGNEPVVIREIIMGLIIESAIQVVFSLDKKSAVHEMPKKGSLKAPRDIHAQCANLANGFFAHREFTNAEREYMSEEPIQMTVAVSWTPRVHGAQISDIHGDDWGGIFPALTPLLTATFLSAKNTRGNIIMVDIVTRPPPGDDGYNVFAYPNEWLIEGFFNVLLPQVASLIMSGKPITVKGFDCFHRLWEVMETTEWFKKLSKEKKWKRVERLHSGRYGKGLNAIKYLIYRGFKPI